MSRGSCYLLDVNVFIARAFEDHVHHRIASAWFSTPGLEWAICPFTEAGFLRYATMPGKGNINIADATAVLDRLAQHPGYHYQPISADWQTLCGQFFRRLHGHNQITDAYLLGLAVREGLKLVTLDKGLVHLAGEHRDCVLVLGGA